jgi:purine-nucleoside/S-methyl-5'-thioadenosine phosphorylase / adenosine deaminase
MTLDLIRWDAPGPYVVAFSTRRGGVSDGPYESLNLGALTDDRPERVARNRHLLCAAVAGDEERLAMNRQVHAADVKRARAGQRGAPGDGLWTDEREVPMLKVTADCLPIALARIDGERPALALLHAGRMGLLEGIVEAGVAAIGSHLGAIVGPGIGACCYEVGPEIRESFTRRFGAGVVRNRMLDLRASAERALRAAGVASVEHVERCTSCESGDFFSHRRDGGVTGRQGVIGYVA